MKRPFCNLVAQTQSPLPSQMRTFNRLNPQPRRSLAVAGIFFQSAEGPVTSIYKPRMLNLGPPWYEAEPRLSTETGATGTIDI